VRIVCCVVNLILSVKSHKDLYALSLSVSLSCIIMNAVSRKSCLYPYRSHSALESCHLVAPKLGSSPPSPFYRSLSFRAYVKRWIAVLQSRSVHLVSPHRERMREHRRLVCCRVVGWFLFVLFNSSTRFTSRGG
jgi:hypothetical protein